MRRQAPPGAWHEVRRLLHRPIEPEWLAFTQVHDDERVLVMLTRLPDVRLREHLDDHRRMRAIPTLPGSGGNHVFPGDCRHGTRITATGRMPDSPRPRRTSREIGP